MGEPQLGMYHPAVDERGKDLAAHFPGRSQLEYGQFMDRFGVHHEADDVFLGVVHVLEYTHVIEKSFREKEKEFRAVYKNRKGFQRN